MLILNAHDVKQSLSMPAAIEGMKLAFAALAGGEVTMPNRAHLDIADHQGVTLVMPSYVAGTNQSLAVKVVSVFPNNHAQGLARIQAAVSVFDPATGRPIALLEGAALTGIRTAAVSGAATDWIAPVSTPVLGVVGAGVQARTHIEAMCSVRTIERIQIYGPTKSKVEQLVADLSQISTIPQEISIVDSGDAAATGADIVCTVSTSHQPVFADSSIKSGTHINAVGSYQPHVREIPADTVVRSLVYVDQREAAWEEAGDLIQPRDAGLISADHIAMELGELASGSVPAKPTGNQVTFFKSVGLAMQDAFAARICVEQARKLGIGQQVEW